ncbi:MarR family winged helix-turn-helix transcriptional regulator [Actinoalloteichus spitiensis]|uniref:MarR family winged helix-turn-helix transcriptional regulator n=1 Tax=Actinoalloteichus spitiensis TaxID=252394 RepID=UPI000379ECE3|nr:MarR family winged helix-turn-helix transcriptional regulator [Actinoalloteichus spitiensis]
MAAERELLLDRVVDALRDIQQTFGVVESPLLQVNLTMQQLRTLVYLVVRRGCSSQELSRLLGVSSATVTGLVDRLESQGLVVRRPDRDDRRVRHVLPTPEGDALVAEVQDSGTASLRTLLVDLEERDLRDLSRILLRLRELAFARVGRAGVAAEGPAAGRPDTPGDPP